MASNRWTKVGGPSTSKPSKAYVQNLSITEEPSDSYLSALRNTPLAAVTKMREDQYQSKLPFGCFSNVLH